MTKTKTEVGNPTMSRDEIATYIMQVLPTLSQIKIDMLWNFLCHLIR